MRERALALCKSAFPTICSIAHDREGSGCQGLPLRKSLAAGTWGTPAPLADRILATALDPDGGAAGANVALRELAAVDPLVEVSASTTVDTVLSKIARGEDPTWAELNAVFGPGGPHEVKAVEAVASPTQPDRPS